MTATAGCKWWPLTSFFLLLTGVKDKGEVDMGGRQWEAELAIALEHHLTPKVHIRQEAGDYNNTQSRLFPLMASLTSLTLPSPTSLGYPLTSR